MHLPRIVCLALVASSGLYLITGTQTPDAQPEALVATTVAETAPGEPLVERESGG